MVECVIAYLVVRCSDDRDAYMGGIMATDEKGLPLEFSYTSPPITPTRLQRVLFGGSLDAYLRRDVIGTQLLHSLKHRPSLIVTSEQLLLDVDGQANCPVVRLQTTSSRGLDAPGAFEEIGPAQRLIQLTEKGSPVRVTATFEDGAAWQGIGTMLVQVAETMDPLEPLARVAEAIDLICKTEQSAEGGAPDS